MEAGCVVSVPLLITGKLANPDYTPQNLDNAAGISCIRRSVNPEYLMYAARHHKGWPSSFMRATLNGRDSRTDAVGEQYTILGSAECLLEMFPKVLKDNIVAKKVSSYCDVASYEGALLFKSYIQVTYDKLWLFSGGEIYPDIDNYNGVMEWEGPQYPCFKNKDFSIEDLQFLTPVDERGICKGRLRSIDISYKPSGGIADTYAVSHRDGHIVKAMCSDLDVGISPGFCVGSCYAPKSQTTKYAVRIYGINCDKYKDSATGQILTAGLTFGPATGEDYTHTHSGQNACGQSGKNCISNMTWEEIVEQSKNDPTIFQNCMEAGCVIPVDLNLIGSITVDEYPYDLSDGDGVGTLRYPISEEYMKWNNASDTTGGWPASRMRATLNGKDVQTDTTVAGSDCLTSDTCLLAAFPDVLRDSIVSKEVHSIAGNAVVISYDKLWLFSESELNKSSTNKDASPYPWAVKSFTSGTLYDPALVPYTETGNTADAWARDSSTFVVTRIPGGASGPSTYPPNMTIGISPGFCIP